MKNFNKKEIIVIILGFVAGGLFYYISEYYLLGSCMCGHGTFRNWKHNRITQPLSSYYEEWLLENEK